MSKANAADEHDMRRMLQILAVVMVVGAALTWAALGANRGWTKTSVPVITVDEVTGIEDRRYEDRFVPGVDFLGGAVLAGGLFMGISLLLSKTPRTKNIET